MSIPFYDTDLTDAAWAWVAPILPAARPGGRPRTTNLRAVLNAIFYLLRTGCQVANVATRISTVWHGLPVYHYFQAFKPGKTPVCGPIYIECFTSRPVVMPDEQLVHRW
jgi:putative transposase